MPGKKKPTTKKPATKRPPTKKPATKKPARRKAPTKLLVKGDKIPDRPKVDKFGKANAVLTGIFKKNEHIVQFDPTLLKKSLPHIHSGSVVINYAIGGVVNQNGVQPCPGYPKGRITQIWGENHSGKTTVCLEASGQTIRSGGQVAYFDWEYEIDPVYASAVVGVPVGSSPWFQWTRPETLEAGFQVILAYAAVGIDLIVIDSVGAAMTRAMDERSLKEIGEGGTGGGGLGQAARLWNDFLPKLKKVITKTGTTVIAISQKRSNIGGGQYSPKTKAQGGKAWEFWAALRFGLSRSTKHKRKEYNALKNKMEETVYAATIRIDIAKCKVAGTTSRSDEFYIRHGLGIDNLWTLVDVAKAHGLVTGGNWLSWTRSNGEEFRQNGFQRFYNALVEDPALQAEFETAVVPLLLTTPQKGVVEDDPDDSLEELLKMSLGDDEDDDDAEVAAVVEAEVVKAATAKVVDGDSK